MITNQLILLNYDMKDNDISVAYIKNNYLLEDYRSNNKYKGLNFLNDLIIKHNIHNDVDIYFNEKRYYKVYDFLHNYMLMNK